MIGLPSILRRRAPHGRHQEPAATTLLADRNRPAPSFTPAPPAPAGWPGPLPPNAAPAPTRQQVEDMNAGRRDDGRRARGPAPIFNAVLQAHKAERSEREPLSVAEAAWRRMRGLAYPPRNGSATGGAYADLMRRVDAITGTTGSAPGSWPLPAITLLGEDGGVL